MSSEVLFENGTQAPPNTVTSLEEAVMDRYKEGARDAQPDLCCPINYEAKYLELLPKEIIERDYGCGDPSAHVGEGERVLDLGSGGGKICYILSQKVTATGSVIGVDFNDEMLGLARSYQTNMADRLGYANVSFRKGKIQDMALNLDKVQTWLQEHPVSSVDDLQALETECTRLRKEEPLVADEAVDVIVSNCVLNLVRTEEKQQLFNEMYRVLAHGGRAVISDIVCDEDPPQSMLDDGHLWSGCISGAFREDHFLKMFEDAGFYGIEILERQAEPWQVVEGIEFRSLTVRAYKGKEGPCMEHNEALIYKGPWSSVTDDDGHTLYRGEKMAVCDKTFGLLTSTNGPYADDVIPVSPHNTVSSEDALPWDSSRPVLRHPSETKGVDYDVTQAAEGNCCGPDGCC